MSKFLPKSKPQRTTDAKAAPRVARNKQPAAPMPPDDDDPVPKNIDEFRRELTRRIINFMRDWRHCRAPVCKRSKRCAGADLRCLRDRPRPKLTHEEQARVMSKVRRALDRRMAELGED